MVTRDSRHISDLPRLEVRMLYPELYPHSTVSFADSSIQYVPPIHG
jgi:hypothetical protein